MNWRRLCYSIDWKPDIDLLSKDDLSTYCELADDSTTTYPGERIDQAELVCLYFISEALATLSQKGADIPSAKHKRYIEWMSHHYASPEARVIVDSSEGRKFMEDQLYRDSVIDNLEKSGPEGRLYISVGRSLGSVLSNDMDALDFLFKGPMLQDFYSSSSFKSNYQKIAAYVDLLAHKNPNQRILEIGAGTGGATAPILHALGPRDLSDRHGTPRYDQYVYTDISKGFFQESKDRFKIHTDRLVFKVLDIEEDPTDQGFEAEKYDLVIASCVLHATSNIDTTLKYTRKLLKPLGKLMLFEPCNLNCSRLSFVFGLLPGWWLGTETHRRWGPLLSDDLWHESLLRNGFSGTDMCLRDYDHSRHTFSVMSSTASSASVPSGAAKTIYVVVTAGSSLQYSIAQRVQDQMLIKPSAACAIISTEEIGTANFEESFCIFLPEVESPFLQGIQSVDFLNLKRMLGAAIGVLWLTYDGGQATRKPEMGLVTGLGRSVCSEKGSLDVMTLALESVSSTTTIVEHIVKIFRTRVENRCETEESEYMESDGLLCVNRVVEANTLNDKVYSAVARQEPELRKFNEKPDRALELTISSPGLLNTLCFIDDTDQHPLASTEVEIAVRAVGVNFKNVLVALGQIPDKSLGQECAGVITRVGEKVEPREWKHGDRVCAITHGAFKTHARSDVSAMFKIPDTMPFTTAAAIPVAYCTAYYALHHIAKLTEGETVLVHAAAGGVGQVAIQIAKIKKAKIYATVGTDEKKNLLSEMYGVPKDHIFSNRNLSFVHGVKRMTHGRGVDVVLNSLAGESLQQSLECVAPLGRFIEIGKKDMYLRNKLPLLPFLQNITFASVDLGVVAERARPLMTELMAETLKLVTENGLQPPRPLHVFRASDIEKAFRSLQSGRNAGKIVVEIHKEDTVPTIPSTKPSWYFDPNATYVIAGGLGGLGRCMARWMMSRGAKHLMILSRSGPQGQAASTLIQELKTKGINVLAVPCDISDESTLVSVLSNYTNGLPPINGCIQACMVLRDGLFENMPFENFEAALRPKVQGSWNLHTHLPKDLDFFVLLSSTGGVFGSRSQSNYATGNTYQDALARYRTANGEKCISLNVGLMLGVGFAAERQQISDSLRSAGYKGIHEAEFLAMLEYFCNPALPQPKPSTSQIITGISTPASLKSKGIAEIFWMSKPLFQNLRQMDRVTGSTSEGSESSVDYKTILISAKSIAAPRDAIAQALVKKLSTALSMPEADIEVEAPIHAYGIDSLVAVEIRYWLLKECQADLAVFHILGSESILKLSLLAAEKSAYLQVGLRNGDGY